MSFLTGTQCELIYSGFATGSALSASTTQTVISPRGNTTPLPYIPAGFFNAAYGSNKALRIVTRGSCLRRQRRRALSPWACISPHPTPLP